MSRPIPYAALAVLSLSALPSAQSRHAEFEPIRMGDRGDLEYTLEFFPGASYDAAITRPDDVLGQPHGSRLSHHAEVVECFTRWAVESPRVRLEAHGATHEGRPLVHCVVTSPENHERLDAILGDVASLSDPRTLDRADAERIVTEGPAVAWMGYGIHGDELSATEASLAVGYHLIASTDADVAALLDDVVIVIDPCLNPDGRERIVSMIEQTHGYMVNLDYASMHRGRWPFGRGNHYLFDMNRDWVAGVCPETRARWETVLRYKPQLFVDSHEMGGLDTFLFYPQNQAHNPLLPKTLDRWQGVFADEAGRAFDRYGWGYYTREWVDAWAPFYSDAWGGMTGAIGILYEQASTDGQPQMRASGEIVTYRESVHEQAVVSLANLRSLRENREAILRDYLATRTRFSSDEEADSGRAFVLPIAGQNPDRVALLLENLLLQQIEVYRVAGPLRLRNVVDVHRDPIGDRAFDGEAYVVFAAQPQGALVRSLLEFDPRMDAEFLHLERERLVKGDSSMIYDTTAWCLPQAYDLEAYWADSPAGGFRGELVTDLPPLPVGRVVPTTDGQPPYAWVVDGGSDSSVRFASRAMELGLSVHVSDRWFTTAGRRFPRGSVLLRRHENPDDVDVDALVARAAADARVEVVSTGSGRSPDEGPDLGGEHFDLLERPRIALLTNQPVSSQAFGHLWHHLDYELRTPFSLLDAGSFGRYDLRRFNVIVVPDGGSSVVREHAESLRDWCRAGGTLVLMSDAASAAANPDLGLSSVRRRRDVLDELETWEFAARRELAAGEIRIDEGDVWDARPTATEEVAEADDDAEAPESGELRDPDAGRQDAWQRRFSPAGVILRGLVDPKDWITAGCRDELCVYYDGSTVLLSEDTSVRLADEGELRVGGLLWPEARERIALGAYVVTEGLGDGQVILFAQNPCFRGMFEGTARLFANAVVYGPGLGAAAPIRW